MGCFFNFNSDNRKGKNMSEQEKKDDGLFNPPKTEGNSTISFQEQNLIKSIVALVQHEVNISSANLYTALALARGHKFVRSIRVMPYNQSNFVRCEARFHHRS